MDYNNKLAIISCVSTIPKNSYIEPFKYDKDIIEKPLDNKHIKFKEYIETNDEHKNNNYR